MLQSFIEGDQWWWSEILRKNYTRETHCLLTRDHSANVLYKHEYDDVHLEAFYVTECVEMILR